MIGIFIQGSSGQLKQDQLTLSVEQTILGMSRIAKKEVLTDIAAGLENSIGAVRHKLSEALNDGEVVSSPLMRLPKEKRRAYQHVFDLIYECSVNRTTAKTLIDHILLKLD